MMLTLSYTMLVSCGNRHGSSGGHGGEGSGGAGASAEAAEVLSIDDIKKIVLERVPGATEEDIVELESEYEDGKYEYEGSIYYNGYVYEFEIDGENGNILSWEIDD